MTLIATEPATLEPVPTPPDRARARKSSVCLAASRANTEIFEPLTVAPSPTSAVFEIVAALRATATPMLASWLKSAVPVASAAESAWTAVPTTTGPTAARATPGSTAALISTVV